MSLFIDSYKELSQGFRDWYFWGYLGWSDIKQRYRRSLIGPFWVTLSMTIFIAALSVVYSRLFKMDVNEYVPFLATGYLGWFFVSTVVIESSQCFIESAPFIKDINLPLSLYIARIIWRNFLIFLHNFLVILGVYVIFRYNPGLHFFVIFPALFLVIINIAWVAILLAILGSRFRDIPPIIQSLIQVIFFVSPIAWVPKLIGHQSKIILLNPVNYFIELIRGPLLGKMPSLLVWDVMLSFAVIGWLVVFMLFTRVYRRVVFWL